ncbi:hypothetical protein ACFWIW_35715 [Amycolatopsis sp. NPDC058340]|uniref:hypothetical protein n=1 Tax=Amycolatopsis sp. NPDC058340 TaxID=3346453 RepID=UPI0036617432
MSSYQLRTVPFTTTRGSKGCLLVARHTDSDEFPFKTTYEGSFTIIPDMLRTVAVRPVLKEHNQETGARWGLFLAEDHILDGDSVFVGAYK